MKKLSLISLVALPLLFSVACNPEAEFKGRSNILIEDGIGENVDGGIPANVNSPTNDQFGNPIDGPQHHPAVGLGFDENGNPITPANPGVTGIGFDQNGNPVQPGNTNVVGISQPVNTNPNLNPLPENPYVVSGSFDQNGNPLPSNQAINGIGFDDNERPLPNVIFQNGRWVYPSNGQPVNNIGVTGHDQFGNPVPGVFFQGGRWICDKGFPVPGPVIGHNQFGNPVFDLPYAPDGGIVPGKGGINNGGTLPPTQGPDCNCNNGGINPGQNPGQNSGGFSPSQNGSIK